SDMSWATEGFAAILFNRVKELRSTRSDIANMILEKIRSLPLHIAHLKLIERIGEGSANLDDLKLALKRRDLLEEGMRNELDEFVKQGGYSGGLAVVVLKNQREQIEILKGKDVKAQIALLAGARYLCDKLPIDSLKELLLKADKPLTSAVQDYLAVEG